jgi:signal transduction histidine kinase
MPKKIFIILALIVVLPLVPLTWLGWRMMQHEQQMIEQQFQTLTTAQLRTADEMIQGYFQKLEKDLTVIAPTLLNDPTALRNYHQPLIRQIFIIDAKGKRAYPAIDKLLSQNEQQFMERTVAIWQDPKLLYINLNNSNDSTSNSKISQAPSSGWYVWYWGAETNHIFWWRDRSQRIIGFEIDPVRLLSELIAKLPDTQPERDQKRIRLVNSNQTIVYQWGNYEPRNSHALSTMQLSYPLGSWKLEYFAPAATHGAAFNRIFIFSGISAFIMALFGLAVYLYREHTRETREALQRVSFVNQVSHELKTPLTNIRMYAELLEDEVAPENKSAGKYLQVIVSESQRLSRLITNVLNFSGLQKGKLSLHLQPGNVDDIIKHCIEIFRPVFSAKSVEIKLNANASHAVQIDAALLEQILNNLFSNVEKYGASGKLLKISSWQEEEMSFIKVQDHGPGIPQNERERIFEPFYRISSKLSDGVTGTGIGLNLARDLARLHGGDIQLLPNEQGACFELALRTPEIEKS